MEMTDQVRNYVRSLDAAALSSVQVEALLEMMLELDPTSGPSPTTKQGQYVAAAVFVSLMQGEPVQSATWHPSTWRTGHAR